MKHTVFDRDPHLLGGAVAAQWLRLRGRVPGFDQLGDLAQFVVAAVCVTTTAAPATSLADCAAMLRGVAEHRPRADQ